MTMRSTFASLAAAFLAAAWPLASAAQTDYPAHTVTMVVPFPPGGVADITARPLADAMTRILRQPVVVENKSGAGTVRIVTNPRRSSLPYAVRVRTHDRQDLTGPKGLPCLPLKTKGK